MEELFEQHYNSVCLVKLIMDPNTGIKSLSVFIFLDVRRSRWCCAGATLSTLRECPAPRDLTLYPRYSFSFYWVLSALPPFRGLQGFRVCSLSRPRRSGAFLGGNEWRGLPRPTDSSEQIQ